MLVELEILYQIVSQAKEVLNLVLVGCHKDRVVKEF